MDYDAFEFEAKDEGIGILSLNMQEDWSRPLIWKTGTRSYLLPGPCLGKVRRRAGIFSVFLIPLFLCQRPPCFQPT
jgi:hypothetical protein